MSGRASAASTPSSAAPEPNAVRPSARPQPPAPPPSAAQYRAARSALLADAGRSGAERRRALAELTDRWLAGLLGDGPGLALVAVGGYGRGELSPHSDLDLLLLHDGAADVGASAERLFYAVWDSGVDLDHAVRTPAETRSLALDDLRVVLGLLSARHVAGDPDLSARTRRAVLADWRRSASRRLLELEHLTRQRAAAHGELASALEPDLKASRGGLRDVEALRAVAASSVADYPRAAVRPAYERLLDVRDALHRVTARAGDRLVLQEQPAVAAELGIDGPEAVLRAVIAAGRTIAHAADVTWRRVHRLAAPARRRWPGARRPAAWRPLADGVIAQAGEVALTATADPGTDAALALRAAAAAAREALPLSESSLARLAAAPTPPNPWPSAVRHQLVALLAAGRPAVAVWEALDQAGIVSSLLPEWDRVQSLRQRSPVHRFTVDRHLVETAAAAAALTRRVRRPDLLLVAALLHDIGKGWPGDHSEAGAEVVAALAPRLGFDAGDTATLVAAVRQHLLLPDVATRRDLDDPATVTAVADTVGSLDRLELLHALAEADASATGPAAAGEWRLRLIAELADRTRARLTASPVATRTPGAGASTPELTAEQSQLLADGGRHVLVRPDRPLWAVTVVDADQPGVLATAAGVLAVHRLAVRSARTHGRGTTAWLQLAVEPEHGSPPGPGLVMADLHRALAGRWDVAGRLARRDDAYAPRRSYPVAPATVAVVAGASRDATVIEVRAADRPGLLHDIGRAFATAGVDIRRSLVDTLGHDAVDVFYVTDADGAALDNAAATAVATRVERALS